MNLFGVKNNPLLGVTIGMIVLIILSKGTCAGVKKACEIWFACNFVKSQILVIIYIFKNLSNKT